MAARHRSRQRALQVLYQWDMTKRPIDETIGAFYDTLHAEGAPGEPAEEPDEDATQGRDEFMEELAKGASEMATDIDHRISAKSAHWKLERMPVVDRNILRLAIYEISRHDTPPAVVIDEALELARQFSGEESVAFINGVLDAVHKEIRN
jgi:N utilization substance protein B